MSLPEYEQAVLDRLAEHNPLGWKPLGRRDGVAMLYVDHPLGEGRVRRSIIRLEPKGMVYLDPVEVELAR